jgi:nitroreductase
VEECAIAVEIHQDWTKSGTKVGSTQYQTAHGTNGEIESGEHQAPDAVDWTKVPGCCVATTKLNDSTGEMQLEEVIKSTSCAVQNFMLGMWSEGIGSKWT